VSLLVDISVVADSIVKAAWARAVANRERLRRRLDVQAVREEAARSGKDIFRETVYTTPTPLLYKPDEPVAPPIRAVQDVISISISIGGLHYAFENLGENVPNLLHVWSADGLTEAISNPFPAGVADPATVPDLSETYSFIWLQEAYGGGVSTSIVLPIGGKACIFLFMQDFITWSIVIADPTNTGTEAAIVHINEESRESSACAFYVDETTARTITVPAAIADRPLGSEGTMDFYLSELDLNISIPTYQPPSPALYEDGYPAFGSGNSLITGVSAGLLVTPSSFLWFDAANQPVAVEYGQGEPPYSVMRPLVNPIAPGLQPIVIIDNWADDDSGRAGGFIEITQSTGYKWIGPDPPDTIIPAAVDDPNWQQISVSPPVDGVKPPEPPFGTNPFRQLFWDWNRPDYCRAQLLALGFQSEDLEP